MYSFSIVIVNWNSGSQLSECVQSISSSLKDNCALNKIIVVDNASVDDSLQVLDKNLDNLMIIQNKENNGFGKACNQGANYASGDFILFLNPDMLVFEDTFTNLFAYIDKNKDDKTAIYGVQLVDDNNHIQKSCARLPKLSSFMIRSLGLNKVSSTYFKSYTMENWDHSETKIVDQVIGAFFMIRKSTFEFLNGFDERFFVYYEELDLSKRVKDSGQTTVYVTEAKAYHKGGGTSENVKALRLFYNTRSRLIYALKHFGFLKGILLLLFTFIVEPISRTAFLILKGKYSEIVENLKGFGLLYKDTFNIIRLGLKGE